VREERQAICELVTAAERVESRSRPAGPLGTGGHVGDWAAPREIADSLPAVPRFDGRLLPGALGPWVMDAADRTQCPPEYAAIGAIVACGAVIGRACTIRPKKHDDWAIVPNVWGAVIGRPGTMKSPALSESLRHVRHLEAEAHTRFESDLAEWQLNQEASKIAHAAHLKRLGKSGDRDAIKAELRSSQESADQPIERRFVVNDSTTEKLGEILVGNPRGMLCVRDELVGFLTTLEREGREGDRAFYLEAWNGTGAFTWDRIGRGTVRIPAACVSVLGGIQPGPFGRYLKGALGGGAGADGLVQRFQLLVYPDPPTQWRNVDRWPDTDARRAAFDLFSRLADPAVAKNVGASSDGADLPFLRFSEDAQLFFDDWSTALMTRLGTANEHDAFEAHLIKYRKLLPALSLIAHLTEAPSGGPVSLHAVTMAAAWCDLLEAHARRIYHAATSADIAGARTVLARLKTGALPSPFFARDVYRKQWAGIGTVAEAEAALAVLEEYGWLRGVEIPPDPAGGYPRPRTSYQAHPSLAVAARAAA
jgi:putative DNA primase/helicase